MTETVQSFGRDPEETLALIVEERERMNDLGLVFETDHAMAKERKLPAPGEQKLSCLPSVARV